MTPRFALLTLLVAALVGAAVWRKAGPVKAVAAALGVVVCAVLLFALLLTFALRGMD